MGLTYCLSNYTYPRASDTFLGSEGFIRTSFRPLGRPALAGSSERTPQFGPAPSEDSPWREGGSVARGGNKDINFISEFKGLFFSNPLLSISLAVSLFSMAGIPPLIGFFSKQLVLYSALQNGYYFISVLAIIVSVISCSYYLQIIKILFTISPAENSTPPLEQDLPLGEVSSERTRSSFGCAGTSPMERADLVKIASRFSDKDSSGEGSYEIKLTNTHSYLISTLTFTILLFFIKPSLILNSTQLLSLSLFYI